MVQKKLMEHAGNDYLTTEGQAVTLVYVDSTKGWKMFKSNEYADATGHLLLLQQQVEQLPLLW